MKIDHAAAGGVVAALRARGLVAADGGRCQLTDAGAALFERLNGAIQRLSRELYADLDDGDLAAAYRVLSAVTKRANELPTQA